jgi:hypothetical protein
MGKGMESCKSRIRKGLGRRKGRRIKKRRKGIGNKEKTGIWIVEKDRRNWS